MKRSEIEVGKKYADRVGRCITVEDLDPGWTVLDGEWVEAKQQSRRFVKGRMMPYQSNFQVRATHHRPKSQGGDRKVVIEPRSLVQPWSEHQKQRKIMREIMGTREEAIERWREVLARKGITDAKIDYEEKTITVSLAVMYDLLGKPKGVDET